MIISQAFLPTFCIASNEELSGWSLGTKLVCMETLSSLLKLSIFAKIIYCTNWSSITGARLIGFCATLHPSCNEWFGFEIMTSFLSSLITLFEINFGKLNFLK